MQKLPTGTSTKGPAEMFTGDVYFDVIAKGEEPSRMRVNTVRFAPCARTAWHTHACGQTLHVTDGIGLVQSRGGEVVVMRPGDTVYTPPGEWHWHGAAPTHFMTHLAMWEAPDPDSGQAETEWGEHVTEDEYQWPAGRDGAVTISEAAQRNHDELFPGHVSTLKVTDPELIEVFDNFAFDEVLRHGDLDVRTRLMVQLAAMIASQALGEYRVMLGAAMTVGVTAVEVKEIVYQAVPYVGLAKVFDFLHTTNEVLAERGIDLPLPAQSVSTPQTRAEVGLAVQNRVVGEQKVTAMYASAAADEAHFQRFLSANCFGDYVARAGIDLRPASC